MDGSTSSTPRGGSARHRSGSDVDPVLVDADHPPAGFAVELSITAFFDLRDQRGGELVVGGSTSACGVTRPRVDCRSRVRRGCCCRPQRDEVDRRGRRAACWRAAGGRACRPTVATPPPRHAPSASAARRPVHPAGAVQHGLTALGAADLIDRGAWAGRAHANVCAPAELGVQARGCPPDLRAAGLDHRPADRRRSTSGSSAGARCSGSRRCLVFVEGRAEDPRSRCSACRPADAASSAARASSAGRPARRPRGVPAASAAKNCSAAGRAVGPGVQDGSRTTRAVAETAAISDA